MGPEQQWTWAVDKELTLNEALAATPTGAAHTQWLTKRIEAIGRLGFVERAYALGGLALGLSLLLDFCGADTPLGAAIAWSGAAALCFALAREVYALVLTQVNAAWFKWLMVPVGTMVAAFSIGSASSVVNAATGQDPSAFKLSVAFMAPVAAIPAVAFFVSVFAGLCVMGMLLAWGSQLASRDAKRSARAWIWFTRTGGAFATLALASPLVEANAGFHAFQVKWAGWMAQGLDMYSDKSCADGNWERVKRINDELVIVVRRSNDGLSFRKEKCPLRAD